MKISIDWLNDFVSTKGIDIKEFCSGMTMTGSKVEGYETQGDDIKKVVVGKIESIQKHENADKLVVCEVLVGDGKKLQIVTGAKNIKIGAKIPVCLDGGKLPGGIKIKEGKLRGELSQGMMCSLDELGLPQSLQDEDGIYLIKEDCNEGDDIKDVLGLCDIAVDFEITSNRPDCLSIRGLAREVAATFGKEFEDRAIELNEISEKTQDNIKVKIESPLCKRYIARVIKDVKVESSPLWMRNRLEKCGIRPINNYVDITNYVMLEYGQPMHAFDAKNIEEDEIIVRNAKSGETLTTLNDQKQNLSEDMLMICDKNAPLSVAGVMGGFKSGINKDTKQVVFESAMFDGSSIRKTSKKLGLRSESSIRFEKGLNLHNCEKAIDRACELVESLGAGRVLKGRVDVINSDSGEKSVDLNTEYINNLLGTDIKKIQMENILKNLDFKVENGKVYPPSYRIDIQSGADIAEEIARIYGYDRIKPTQFRGACSGQYTPMQIFLRDTKEILYGFGMSEIYTYSFMSQKNFDRLNLDKNHNLRDTIKIKNPLGEDTKVMRTTMVPSMLEVLSKNYNNKNETARLFELSRIYINKGEKELADERQRLIIGFYGDCDFYSLKGATTSLLKLIRVENFELCKSTKMPYHKYRFMDILKDNIPVGSMGEIDKRVSDNYGINTKVYIAELYLDELFKLKTKNIKYEPISKYPSIVRDLSLICDIDLPVLKIEKAIKLKAGNLLKQLKLFDVYKGKQIKENQKSVSLKLKFSSKERTLKDQEIDNIIADVLKELEKSGIYIRK